MKSWPLRALLVIVYRLNKYKNYRLNGKTCKQLNTILNAVPIRQSIIRRTGRIVYSIAYVRNRLISQLLQTVTKPTRGNDVLRISSLEGSGIHPNFDQRRIQTLILLCASLSLSSVENTDLNRVTLSCYPYIWPFLQICSVKKLLKAIYSRSKRVGTI